MKSLARWFGLRDVTMGFDDDVEEKTIEPKKVWVGEMHIEFDNKYWFKMRREMKTDSLMETFSDVIDWFHGDQGSTYLIESDMGGKSYQSLVKSKIISISYKKVYIEDPWDEEVRDEEE